jgi:hypothetical protein
MAAPASVPLVRIAEVRPLTALNLSGTATSGLIDPSRAVQIFGQMSIKKYAISHGSGEIIWGRYPVLWLHRRDSGSAEPGWREQSANDLNGHGPRVGLAPHRIPYAGAPKRSSPDASSGCLRVHGTQIKAAGRPAYGRWHGTESAGQGVAPEIKFAGDSLLEEAGFEPSVPRKAPGVPAVPALVRAVFRLEGSRRNRWFESGSLQQRVRTKPLTPRA